MLNEKLVIVKITPLICYQEIVQRQHLGHNFPNKNQCLTMGSKRSE